MVDSKSLTRNYSTFLYSLKFLFFALLFLCSVENVDGCSRTQFKVAHADGSTSCEDCEKCYPGRGLSHECEKVISSDAMVTCVPCQPGVSFSSNYDTSSCTPCAPPCLADQVVLQKCTPTENVRCAKQCYSKEKYYDHTSIDCLVCSKCCGDDGDVVEDECKKKLGATSNKICSFHSSVNRCSTTTASVHGQQGTSYLSPLTRPTNSSGTPSDTTDLLPFITQDDLKSPHPPVTTKDLRTFERKDSPQSEADSRSTAEIVVVPILAILAIFGYATYHRCKRNTRTYSFSTCNDDIETGCHHTEAQVGVCESHKDGKDMKSRKGDQVELVEIQKGPNNPLLGKDAAQLTCECQTVKCSSMKDAKDEKSIPNDQVELEELQKGPNNPLSGKVHIREDTPAQLTCECQTQKCSRKESKPLKSLLDEINTLRRICVVFDAHMPGCGDYQAVAQHYGFDHYERKSVLEKTDSPTRALIEGLAASHPNLTVEEFAVEVEEKTKRGDVSKLLRKYDFM